MKRLATFAAMCAATLVFLTTTPSVCAQYSRRTAIVEAVRKTRDGIVTIKCERPDGSNGATGTGVIVDEHGYIVTSRHVVATAGKVRITLADGSKLTAQITAEETQTDLAILKVTPDKPLKALSLGPCSDLMVGETVIAVGNPYGYTNTVSTGIISALDRSIPLPAGDTLGGVIQINASINPGNSGGPLLNINGEWIGINAALRDGAQGIAFAINADTVKEMLNRHLSSRKLANVNHGLSCAEKVSEEGSARQHVVVASVLAETPAALAGIEAGDVILCVADRTVSNRFDIERSLWDHKPGEKVRVRVMRQQKEITVALKLGACSKHEATVERTASARR